MPSGTSALLRTHHQLCGSIDEGDEDEAEKTDCNKETGEKQQLRKWTRGVWMCVNTDLATSVQVSSKS